MPPAIPDRWIPYKALGKIIEGTRIICFKVPLRKNVQIGNSEITDIWDIPTLLLQIPNLGAVINLTNTTRYYDPREFKAAGILYRHVAMPGRELPRENLVKQFMDTVDEFLGNGCESLVGIHCTHGLNRTGYMVCRYMRDRLQIPAKDAIKRFEQARGYEIERENYIADLLGKKPAPPDFGKNTKVTNWRDECVGTPEIENESREVRKRSRKDSESNYHGSKNPCLSKPEAESKISTRDESSESKREGKKKRKKRTKKKRVRKRGKKDKVASGQ